MNEKRITIAKLKEVIAMKRWNPYKDNMETSKKTMDERKWLTAALKILENEVGISEDEFRYRFGSIGAEAMGPNIS